MGKHLPLHSLSAICALESSRLSVTSNELRRSEGKPIDRGDEAIDDGHPSVPVVIRRGDHQFIFT